MAPADFVIHPDTLFAFDDIIDGYFPLRTSLAQLMERLGTSEAVVEIQHAPVMRIPGLAPTAPVPLRVERGELGQIDHMVLYVRRCGTALGLRGQGEWRWFQSSAQERLFDPLTRLAEPAYLTGFSLHPPQAGSIVSSSQSAAKRVTARAQTNFSDVQAAFTRDNCTVLGPIRREASGIEYRQPASQTQSVDDVWFVVSPLPASADRAGVFHVSDTR